MTSKTLIGTCVGMLASVYALACSSSAPDDSGSKQSPAPTATVPATPIGATTPPATEYTTPTTVVGTDASYLPTPTIDGGAAGACSAQTGKPQCDTCITQSCCAQVTACDSDPECVAVDNCTSLCAQQYAYNPSYAQQCANTCYQQHPTGGQKLNVVYQCVQATCLAQCQ